MEENLTTMRKEVGTIPPPEEGVAVLKEKFEKRLGSLENASLNPEIIEKMKQLELYQYLPQRSHQAMNIPDFAGLPHEADSPYFSLQPA
jgi:lipoate-protein ligase A